MKVNAGQVAGYDPREPKTGPVPPPGKAQILCSSVEVKESSKGDTYFRCKFQVVAHEDDSAVGLNFFSNLFVHGKAVRGSIDYCIAAGLMTLEAYLQQMAENPADLDLPMDKLEGTVVCCTLKNELYNNRPQAVIDMFQPLVNSGSPEADTYPRDSQLIPKKSVPPPTTPSKSKVEPECPW